MNKILALVFASFLALTACGDDNGNSDGPRPDGGREPTYDGYVDWYYDTVSTPLGEVECVYGDLGKGGGPSCNWEKFNQEREDKADDDAELG